MQELGSFPFLFRPFSRIHLQGESKSLRCQNYINADVPMNVPAHVVVHRTERLFLEMTIILKPSWSFRGYIEANLGYIDAMLCYIIEVI